MSGWTHPKRARCESARCPWPCCARPCYFAFRVKYVRIDVRQRFFDVINNDEAKTKTKPKDRQAYFETVADRSTVLETAIRTATLSHHDTILFLKYRYIYKCITQFAISPRRRRRTNWIDYQQGQYFKQKQLQNNVRFGMLLPVRESEHVVELNRAETLCFRFFFSFVKKNRNCHVKDHQNSSKNKKHLKDTVSRPNSYTVTQC